MLRKRFVIQGHSSPVYGASFSFPYIYSTSGDKKIARWFSDSGKQDPSFVVRLEEVAYCIASSETYLFVASTKGTISCIHTNSKELLWEKNLFGHAIFSIEIDEISERIYFGDHEGNFTVLNFTGEKLISLPLACGKIRVVKIIEKLVFVASNEGDVCVFETENFNQISHLKISSGVSSLKYDALGKVLFLASRDAHLYIYDLLTASELSKIPLHRQTIYGLLRIDSFLITCSQDKTIKIWNTDDWTCIQRIEHKDGGHNRSINGLLKIGKNQLLTFSDDKTLILWDWIPE